MVCLYHEIFYPLRNCLKSFNISHLMYPYILHNLKKSNLNHSFMKWSTSCYKNNLI